MTWSRPVGQNRLSGGEFPVRCAASSQVSSRRVMTRRFVGASPYEEYAESASVGWRGSQSPYGARVCETELKDLHQHPKNWALAFCHTGRGRAVHLGNDLHLNRK